MPEAASRRALISRHSFQATHSNTRPPAEQQPHDLEQLHRHRRERDPHQGRGHDAERDDAGAVLRRQTRRDQADDDRVVPGEHEVDDDD